MSEELTLINDYEINKKEIKDIEVIDKNNTRFPHECSSEDLEILSFQDDLVKYKKILDEYKPYTEALMYGYHKVKSVSSFVKVIF